jgi:hypothetical protein
MSNKIFVIAGNYDQFNTFRKTLIRTMVEEDIPLHYQDIIYVEKDRMYGYNDVWGYKVGTWNQRSDIEEICNMLLTRFSSIDEFIEVEL